MEANFGKNVAFENVICSSTEKEKTKLYLTKKLVFVSFLMLDDNFDIYSYIVSMGGLYLEDSTFGNWKFERLSAIRHLVI